MPYSYLHPPPPNPPFDFFSSRRPHGSAAPPPDGHRTAPPPLLEIFPTVGSVGEERRRMASRILITLRAGATLLTCTNSRTPNLPNSFAQRRDKRNFSIKSSSSLEPPDVHHLAGTARISLTPQEVEEFGPKIQQVVQWFGQLQAVDLANVEPAIRSDIDGDNLREDVPQTFENREAIIAGIPSYEEPYIKVPKVLNKE